jgi:SAM-dependent methyltransferase
MSALNILRCPACGGVLEDSDLGRLTCLARFSCPSRTSGFPRLHGLFDLRLHLDYPVEPAPLPTSVFEPIFRAQEQGRPFKVVFEETLLALDETTADRLMQIVHEGRGAWFPLLFARGGALLFVGNALSGTVTALTQAGFRVTVLDPSPERVRFGNYRNHAHSPGLTSSFVGGDSPILPFIDQSFDVVVREGGFPGASPAFAFGLEECRRVTRSEVLWITNNRLGYKRATGRRGIHYVPGPVEYAFSAMRPLEGEKSLPRMRREIVGPGFAPPRAYALYPHAADFTHVVALDALRPALTIGPMERRNRLKLLAQRAGLFPVLAPSFAVLAARVAAAGRAPRIERILDEIAERTGEPRPEIDQLVATRGNCAIVHTRVPEDREEDGRGRWTLHLPLNPTNVPQAARHFEVLERIRRRFPELPAPEPLFHGRADGVLLTCERRLPGWSAPQVIEDRGRAGRMLADVSAHFARLVVRPAARFTAEDFEEIVGSRFDLAAHFAAVPSTLAAIERLRAEARERLVGKTIPRVFHHADLRAKHVQVGQDGGVIGYLDWSAAEDEFLPYQDLLHLIVHDLVQEHAIPARKAWWIVRDRTGLRDHEREALASYAAAVGIDDETARAIEAIYPVLVSAMVERHWDFSRPRWLHRQFGV